MPTFETGYRSFLAAKLNEDDVTCSVAIAPTVTAGRMHIYKGNTHAWIKYTGVTGTNLTGVTFVSPTGDPANTETGQIFPAGSKIELVAMHDQLSDKQWGSLVKVYANTATRDADLTTPENGMSCYITADGTFTDYVSGAWVTRATGAVVNASTTVSGKVEIATSLEASTGAATGGTGSILSLTPRNLSDIYYFGDGSDGDVTISSNTSLTRDMFYNDLTINTGITLDPAGYAIYVLGTLTFVGTGKIARNGNAAVINVGGAALATGTCGPCLGGLNGASGSAGGAGSNGNNGVAVATSYKTTGSSVAGGNGGAGTNPGGTGGTSAAHTQGALYNKLYTLPTALRMVSIPSRVITYSQYGGLASSGSGGSGGSVATGTGGTGGGSGGNGGIILLFANVISGAGTIEAKGGVGGNGSNGGGTNQGGGGGGGGGGCGGVIYLVYRSGTVPTLNVSGGAAGVFGLGANGGSNGVGGTAGTAGQTITITV